MNNYKFRIKEYPPNGFGLKRFCVQYTEDGFWCPDWKRYVGYQGDDGEFDTLEEAKAFIARDIKLMRDAEPKYHQYP